MKKIKPILICGGLLLSAGLALSACHTPEKQSTSPSKTSTSQTTEKATKPSKEKKTNPFATLPKSEKKATTPSIPKENESAMQNFAKATLNRILNGAREEKKSVEGNTSNALERAVEAKGTPLESVEKPVHLTMADIDTKPSRLHTGLPRPQRHCPLRPLGRHRRRQRHRFRLRLPRRRHP